MLEEEVFWFIVQCHGLCRNLGGSWLHCIRKKEAENNEYSRSIYTAQNSIPGKSTTIFIVVLSTSVTRVQKSRINMPRA